MEALIDWARGFAKAVARAWEAVKRFLRRFCRRFQRTYAEYVIKHGMPEEKSRARVFLRTKNRRIKRKQWKAITKGAVL